MRVKLTITVLALAVGLGAVVAAAAQPEAVMTIAGIPGQIGIMVDRTDWTQVRGMPDPRTSQSSDTTSIMGARPASPLTSRGGSVGGRDQGRAEMVDFSIEKYVDKSSPTLHDKLASGDHVDEARMEIVTAGRDRGTRLVITMTGVVISRIVEHAATGRDRPTETVTVTCQSLEWESQPTSSLSRVSTPAYSLTPRPR
jgi:type VI protein secretion system component Hcp